MAAPTARRQRLENIAGDFRKKPLNYIRDLHQDPVVAALKIVCQHEGFREARFERLCINARGRAAEGIGQILPYPPLGFLSAPVYILAMIGLTPSGGCAYDVQDNAQRVIWMRSAS